MKLTAQIVREFLDYDKSTGLMTWRQRRREWFLTARAHAIWNTRFVEEVAGHLSEQPGGLRRKICIMGRKYYAARLAFLHTTGCWPTEEIDHKDGNQLNDRWENLREATSSQNSQNCKLRIDNTTGFTGVYFNIPRQKFYSQIKMNGKTVQLGYFSTVDAAAIAYQRAAREDFGEFFREPARPLGVGV